MDTKTADGVVGEVSHAQLRPDAAGAGARRRRTRCGTATASEYLDFTSGIAVTSLGHCHPRGDRRHPGGGGHAAARLQHLPQRAAGPPGQAAGRALVRRPRVLLQLGRGGQRGRPQGRPQVRQGTAGHRPLRGHRHPQLVPRPHAGHRERHRPAEVPARLRAAHAGLQARAVQRPARDGARDRQPHGGHPGRADPGRGRRLRPRRRLPARACASSATSPAPC